MRVSLYAEIIQTQLDPAAERLHCTGAQNIHIHSHCPLLSIHFTVGVWFSRCHKF